MRDPRDGLKYLPLPNQHPAPREVAVQHHLEGGVVLSSAALWFTTFWEGFATRWIGTDARLALLASLCGGGDGGQARPSRLPAEGGGCDGGCEV